MATKKAKTIKTRDMFGTFIGAGDFIVYPCRKKSDTYMRTAKVLNVRERTNHLEEKEVVLDVVMAKKPRHFERAAGHHETTLHKVTVSCPFRSVVVPKHNIQNDRYYKHLLEA